MRKRFNFWLDDRRGEDWRINELITTLKSAGEFTRAIREGLRLWVDLRANKTDVLYELFPHLKPQPTPPITSGGGQSELAKEIAAQIVLMNGNTGYLMQSSNLLQPAPPLPNSEATGTIISSLYKPPTGKQLASPKFDLPSFEDDSDEPTVLVRASTDTSSAANLIAALRSMA